MCKIHNVLIMVISIIVLCYCQDKNECDVYITKSIDRFTNKVSYISNIQGIIIKNNSEESALESALQIVLIKYKNYMSFCIRLYDVHQPIGIGMKGDEKIIILFKNNTTMELISQADFNFEGSAIILFGESMYENELEILTKNEISAIRVHTYDSYFDFDFTNENAQKFYKVINCLNNIN